MLPAWMIDKIKRDDELARRNSERQVDRPALDERGILQRDDIQQDVRFHTSR